jgi:hypothetical protein
MIIEMGGRIEIQMEIQIQIGTDHPVMAENLLRTEDVYRKVCIKLRQLVAGWSWIKPFPRYHTEQWAKLAG